MFFFNFLSLANMDMKKDKMLHYIRKKKCEYSSAFTIHGLMRIFHGDKYERMFWTSILILGISLTVYLLCGQVGYKR